MNEAGKDTHISAETVPAGGIPKTAREFARWRSHSALTYTQYKQADVVDLSFQMLALNKNNPAALAKAQQMHDADMAKLEAMFNP